MQRPLLVVFSLGAVLLSTGCGGGGSGDRLSETAFRTRANHICSELYRREKPDLSTSSKAAVDRNLSRIDSALSRLQGLRPPADDESRYHSLLTRFRRSVAFVRAHESVLIELTGQMRSHPSDTHLTAQYEQLAGTFVHEVRLAGEDATALGLTACANGLTGGSSSSG